MRIVALLTVRNEAHYLETCLRHLISEGVEICLIDNDSTDSTLKIAKDYLGKGVSRIERLPFTGAFELVAQCKQQEQLAKEIEADWFIHHDADEIRQSPFEKFRLCDAIKMVDKAGYNAINFAELVFIPMEPAEAENANYVQAFKHYYYFSPREHHRLNAWKKQAGGVDLTRAGGHRVDFDGIRVFPTDFILRHYIFLSKWHGEQKYQSRVYSDLELKSIGWHRQRANWADKELHFPKVERLKTLANSGGPFDLSQPEAKHLFEFRDRNHD
jgi:glycosyltransferase involved in cell wall biosynthesis